jgi:uncharacterized protein (DUF362 family)
MFTHVIDPACRYPTAPFAPDTAYPELAGIAADRDPGNRVYPAIREVFRSMGWDASRFGTAAWDPLGHLVEGRDRVVIKPNLVLHRVGELAASIDGLVVHASVLRPIVDYLLVAARNARRSIQIAIADTPLQSANFQSLCDGNGLTALMEHYRACGAENVTLHDLRFEQAVINDNFLILRRVPLAGDPAGACIVDVGQRSAHLPPGPGRADFSIQDYDDEATRTSHTGQTHRYRFSRTVLNADLVINVAKLKCHSKSGVTLGLKNIVGANVSKAYLPHFRSGDASQGGDEYPRATLYTRAARALRNGFNRGGLRSLAPLHALLKRVAYAVESGRRRLNVETGFGGAWHGNDTLWRTIVDINRVLFFADREGVLRSEAQRRVVYVLDGIVGMEGDGPIKGTDVRAGVIACGDDPVEFDAYATALMGLDPERVPHIVYWRDAQELRIGRYPEHIDLSAGRDGVPVFREPSGWAGRLAAAPESRSARPRVA